MIKIKLTILLSILFISIQLIGCKNDKENRHTEQIPKSDTDRINIMDANEIKIECKLSIERDFFAIIEFSNGGEKVIPILKRNLLLEDQLTWSAFNIKRDSVEVRYKGTTIKRPAPKRSDYYYLNPNSKIESSVNISKYYDITIPGRYTIEYRSVNVIPQTDIYFEIKSNAEIIVIR